MKDSRKDQEIDLYDLLMMGVNTFRANFWLILLSFFLGCVLGVAYYLFSKKVYQSKMMISSNILTTSYANLLFTNANQLLLEGNTDAIAKQLNMPVSDVENVSELKIENIMKGDGKELVESDRYLITVEVYDQKVLPALQKGLMSYLENNEFVKIRVQQNKDFLREMLSNTENEIKDIQLIKTGIANGKFFEPIKGNLMFDPTAINTKLLELNEKRISYKNSLALSNSVQLIDGFVNFKKQIRPKLLGSLGGGAIAGLGFVALLITFKSIRKLLTLAEERKNADAS